jgi:hypothetical protein
MTTTIAGRDGLRTPLHKVRTVPLDRLSGTDVSTIVQKVVSTHLDQTRITAAKFSSFI